MSKRRASPVCEVHSVDADVVARLLPSIEQTTGIGEFFSALADDTRVKILYALSESEMCVCDIGAITGSSKAVASYHLRLLYRMGLTEYRRDGRRVYYRLADPALKSLLKAAIEYGAGRGRADDGASGG
jgi:DNA-binding transcriptional ArsR family regulator